MKKLKAPQIITQHFVPKLHEKFLRDIPSPGRFEKLMLDLGGKLRLDHGATRTPDPTVHALITRIAGAMGLIVHNQYTFPEKKLTAVDLQSASMKGFKWFSTLIEYPKLSPKAITLVEEDMARSSNKFSDLGMSLLEKLEKDDELSESETASFVHEIVFVFLQRQGKPAKKATIEALKAESSELVNALLVGPDFNHLAYLLNDLEIPGWFGLDVIDLLDSYLRQQGFPMLPELQGAPGSILRQTSTQADSMKFSVEEASGSTVIIESPAKYLEFIQRGAVRDDKDRPLFKHGQVERFQGFIAKNTVKIYDSTR